MKKSKAQVSIFVVIALILLILLVFLIFTSLSDHRAKLGLFIETQEELLPIKENLDVCLEKQLKRAVLISGMKGGFIYDNGEYYMPRSGAAKYDNRLIENFELNWNSLLHNTLVHHQTGVFVPKLNTPYVLNYASGPIEIYTKSIRDDFELFILEEFIKCVDLERYTEAGFEVEFESYGGQIKRFVSETNLELINFDAEVGDRVQFSLFGEVFLGEVISTGFTSVLVKMDDDELSKRNTPFELSNINALNLDGNIDIEVVFEDEKVGVSLSYPVTLKSGEKVVSYKSLFVETEVRQKKLIEIGEALLQEKNANRELNLFNIDEIVDVLEDVPYLRNTDLHDFSISIGRNNDSEEYKSYVISIIDENSRILGSPYIMSFGYENEAPNIDISQFAEPDLAERGVIAILSENEEFEIDLKTITSDPQALDNFNSYFIEDLYTGIDAYYELSSDGILKFQGFQEKLYTFDVKVTDKEAIRTVPIKFLVGFPDNSDNQAADQCFSFRNFGIDGSFPIHGDYNNKVFSFTNSLGVKEAYGFSLYIPSSNPLSSQLQNSIVNFAPSCIVSDTLFGAFYTLVGATTGANLGFGSLIGGSGDIQIPITNEPVIVRVTVLSASNIFTGLGVGNLGTIPSVTPPYTMTVYPAACLGPEEDADSAIGNCCNTNALDSAIDSNSPQNFYANNNLWSDGRVILQTEAYFCNDVHAKHKSGNFANVFEFLNIWNIDSKATDLLESNVVMACNGGSSYGDFTSISISGADYNSQVTGYGSSQALISTSITGSFRTVDTGSTCNFCYISNPENFVIELSSGLTYVAGLKSDNSASDVGISPIFNDGQYNDLNVVCEDGGESGFCAQGTDTCIIGPGFPDGPPPLPGTFPGDPPDLPGDPQDDDSGSDSDAVPGIPDIPGDPTDTSGDSGDTGDSGDDGSSDDGDFVIPVLPGDPTAG